MSNIPLEKLQKIYQSRYVSHQDLTDFLAEHHLATPTKSCLIKKQAKYLLTLQLRKLRNFNRTTGKLYKLSNHRDQLNRDFIKREQKKSYQIEGNELDPQQIAAVVACEDAELILAPAGSGKTASLLAKLDYLTSELHIPVEHILVIAFTNKVVAELKDRVKQPNLEIRTFHSFGNKIIKQKFKTHRLISEQETTRFFQQSVQSLKSSDPVYRKTYTDYLRSSAPEEYTFTLPDSPTQDPATAFVTLAISILGLQKAERVTLIELKSRIGQIIDPATRKQAENFYTLYAPIAQKYAEHLERNQLYDFADMLNLATDIINQTPSDSLPYQYVLVDEAQDLSTSKYLLLKALLAKCHRAKLFAVGDDWQSIYRFAGSNLRVLDNFEKIFSRTTYRGLIELTYRFGQPTAKLSNRFIQKNPHQSRKKVTPHVKRRTPITVALNLTRPTKSTPPDYHTLDQKLQDLYQQYGDQLFAKKIQIISRYNRDIYRLVPEDTQKYQNAKLVNAHESNMELSWRVKGVKKKLKIPFCSMHRAKGITRDIIFVINANSGNHGMPATRGSDPVAETLLTKLDTYPDAEERRLFYVAITRAKEQTIIISDAWHISPFVFEISPRLTGAGVRVCPKCRRGIIQKHRRKRDGKIYYSCSNYAGGCRYVE